MVEEWREIQGWSNYRISNLGKVKRIACTFGSKRFGIRRFKERLLAVHTWTDQRGHRRLYITLGHDRVKRQNRTIGRLVLETFIGPPEEGQECRHLDDNYLNCTLDNLLWGTHKQNSTDAVKNGKIKRGEQSGRSKLTPDQVIAIRSMYVKGVHGRGANTIAKMFGVSPPTVLGIVKGTLWKHI